MTNSLFVLYRRLRQRPRQRAEIGQIRQQLKRVPLFEMLGGDTLDSLINQSLLQHFGKGVRLIIQGASGRELFVLLEGTVGVVRRLPTGFSQELAQLNAPTVFGEIAVLQDTKRTADVIAKSSVDVLVVDRDAVKSLQFGKGAEDHNKLISQIMLQQYMSSSNLFKEIPKEIMQLFTSSGLFQNYKKGQSIFQEGAEGDSFYLLVRGLVSVLIQGKEVQRIEQGGFFGEMALLTRTPRSATITALEDAVVYRIDRAHFWNILAENLNLAMFIETVADLRTYQDEHVLRRAQ